MSSLCGMRVMSDSRSIVAYGRKPGPARRTELNDSAVDLAAPSP